MSHKRTKEQKTAPIQEKSNTTKKRQLRSELEGDKYQMKNEHFQKNLSRCYRFTKYLKLIFVAILVLNILAPIVVYAWPGIMGHMIFQTFSNCICLFVFKLSFSNFFYITISLRSVQKLIKSGRIRFE